MTGEATMTTTAPSMPASLHAFIEAATDSVAREIAELRREAQREKYIRDAEHRALMTEMRMAAAEMQRQFTARLETLKDGAPGKDGRDGVDGKDGKDGEPGAAGKDGSPGIAIPGADGKDGQDGERGSEGPAGKLPLVREWTDSVHYESDVVFHAGSTYQALRDTAKEPPHDDWICIASGGRNGQDGKSLSVRGTWSATEQYKSLEIVALNGGSFVSRRDNPGPCPGEGWQLVASQGKQGKPGPHGQAERGRAGPPVVSMSIDGDGNLTLTNADGSTVTCDLYPVLSRIA